MTIVADLSRRLSDLAATLPEPRQMPGQFSVEPIVAALAAEPEILLAQTGDLDVLQRKTEVARRLGAFYTPDAKLRVGDDVVHPDYALALCAIFLLFAERSNNAKYLNTALKMLDGILLAPTMPEDPFLSECALKLATRVGIPDA